MIDFPVSIVDGFYNDPDAVREFALAQHFSSDTEGRYPGKRTECLSIINRELYDYTCNKLFSLYYDFFNSDIQIQWQVTTQFHLIESLSEEEDSVLNAGWVHQDEGLLGGVVYLNNSRDKFGGTNIYKPDVRFVDMDQSVRKHFYMTGEVDEHYQDRYNKHIRQFKKTVSVDNEYNRLISFSSKEYHAPDTFYCTEPRLTQVIFVSTIDSNSKTPLSRL